jgi:hypothetical protein
VAAVTGMTCEVFAEASIKNFYELAREGLHDAARYGLLWKILTMPWASGKLADYVDGGADYRVDVSSDSGRCGSYSIREHPTPSNGNRCRARRRPASARRWRCPG